MNRSLLTALILCSILCLPISSNAEENKTSPASAECAPDDRKCRIDRRIEELEKEAEEISQDYLKRDMWKLPSMLEEEKPKKPKKTKYGLKALKYPIVFPIYATRLLTWPIALTTNTLVKTGVVRTVIDIVSNDERTLWVYPIIELGFGSGFGGGLGVTHFDLFKKNYKLSARYQIHLNLDQKAKISISKPDLFFAAGKPFAFKFSTEYERGNESEYFGKGIDTSKDIAGRYGFDVVRSGGHFGYEVIKNMLVGVHASIVWTQSRNAKSGPFVQNVFSQADLTAFDRSLVYLVYGVGFVHDDRDSEVVPTRGGKRMFAFSRFGGFGVNNFDYNQFDVEVFQYFPILWDRHVIALRTAWTFQQETGAGIPFNRLARFDTDSPMRGFVWGRFRDHSVAVFNVEYRYPVWKYMDGQIFIDAGRAFDGVQNFSFKDFKFSGGIGFNFRTSDYFLARFQVAGGGEGIRVLFKTSQAF